MEIYVLTKEVRSGWAEYELTIMGVALSEDDANEWLHQQRDTLSTTYDWVKHTPINFSDNPQV